MHDPIRYQGKSTSKGNGEFVIVPHVHEHRDVVEHPGHRVIAVCGKGGVGKTALCALMTHAMIHRPDSGRILVVDADPAFGLSLALGVTPAHTIASVRDDLLAAATSGSDDEEREIAGKLDYLVFQAMEETDDFALVAMGRSHELGCYCSVNDLLRDALEMLVDQFDTILIDGEAGLEQINRQVVTTLNRLVVVSDGSARGQHTVETIWDMAHENDLAPEKDICLVLNRQQEGMPVAPLREDVRPRMLGSIPSSEALATYDREGIPLIGLDHDDPAAQAVWDVVGKLWEA